MPYILAGGALPVLAWRMCALKRTYWVTVHTCTRACVVDCTIANYPYSAPITASRCALQHSTAVMIVMVVVLMSPADVRNAENPFEADLFEVTGCSLSLREQGQARKETYRRQVRALGMCGEAIP